MVTKDYSSITHITTAFMKNKKYPDAHLQLNAIYSRYLRDIDVLFATEERTMISHQAMDNLQELIINSIASDPATIGDIGDIADIVQQMHMRGKIRKKTLPRLTNWKDVQHLFDSALEMRATEIEIQISFHHVHINPDGIYDLNNWDNFSTPPIPSISAPTTNVDTPSTYESKGSTSPSAANIAKEIATVITANQASTKDIVN